MKWFYIVAFLAFLGPINSLAGETVFRFHSGLEPSAVDPIALTESTGGYMFANLYRSLFRLDQNGNPIPELAENCDFKDKRRTLLICRLRPDIAFSNGEPIKSRHFIFAWQRLADPKSGSRHGDLLSSIKNAKAVAAGNLSPDQLDVKATDDQTLQIRLEAPDEEIFFTLASPLLTPLLSVPSKEPAEFAQTITTGPYRITGWEKKTRIRLENNSNYFNKTNRSPVEILLIDEDATALQMFDLGKLDFLRRLNVKEIPFRKDQPGFIFHPATRFDYVGFAGALSLDNNFRKALALSLNYEELTAAYKTPGQVGCPSFSKHLADPWPCLKFDLAQAKKAWSSVSEAKRKQPVVLLFSRAGGEDIGRGMEWMQSQWKKHLGLQVELRPMENSMYLSELKLRKADIFRKGVNLDRPTCSAALENFASQSPENYIALKNPRFDRIVAKIHQARNESERKKWCGKGLKELLDNYYLIPQGEIYFAMLENQKFKGFYLTPLNQLDLTLLQPKD